jgi:hypothetical protein
MSVIKEIGTLQGLNDRRLWHIWLIILLGGSAVLQAPVLNSFSFDFFSFQQNDVAASFKSTFPR